MKERDIEYLIKIRDRIKVYLSFSSIKEEEKDILEYYLDKFDLTNQEISVVEYIGGNITGRVISEKPNWDKLGEESKKRKINY